MEILELKSTIFGIKHSLDGIDIWPYQEKALVTLKIEVTQTEAQEKKRLFKNKRNLNYLSNYIKQSNVHVMGVSKGKERKNQAENYI